MSVLCHVLFYLGLSVWLGEIIFFSFIVAPAIFQALPRDLAGLPLERIFPKYYAIGYFCGIIMLASSIYIGWGAWGRPLCGIVTCLLLMLALSFYAGNVIRPNIAKVKESIAATATNPDIRSKAQTEFNRLHGISMGLNGFVLLLGLILLFFTAWWKP